MFKIHTKSGTFAVVTIRVPVLLKKQALQHRVNLTQACTQGLKEALELIKMEKLQDEE